MKMSRDAVLMFVVGIVCLPSVFAGPIDPRMILGGDPAATEIVTADGSSFVFHSIGCDTNASCGGGLIDVYNQSGFLWTSLTITVPQPFLILPTGDRLAYLPGDYTLETSLFHVGEEGPIFGFEHVAEPSFDETHHTVTFFFYGGPGLPSQTHIHENDDCWVGPALGIGLFDENSNIQTVNDVYTGGWLDQSRHGLEFTAVANVPEPGTLMLLSLGLLALGPQFVGRNRSNRA